MTVVNNLEFITLSKESQLTQIIPDKGIDLALSLFSFSNYSTSETKLTLPL